MHTHREMGMRHTQIGRRPELPLVIGASSIGVRRTLPRDRRMVLRSPPAARPSARAASFPRFLSCSRSPLPRTDGGPDEVCPARHQYDVANRGSGRIARHARLHDRRRSRCPTAANQYGAFDQLKCCALLGIARRSAWGNTTMQKSDFAGHYPDTSFVRAMI